VWKLVILALLALLVWRLVTGRWPWSPRRISQTALSVAEARRMLGVSADAGRLEVIAAHRQLITRIHPDRGGSGTDTQAANAARDVLLSRLDPTD
jgi:hypothetical protein